MKNLSDLAAVIQPHPIRPLDPAWFDKFLTDDQLNHDKIKKIVAALEKYNKVCNAAADELNETFYNI
jgi:hypothetical protein